MPHAHTQLTYHVVFSTRDRRELIRDDLRARLYRYIGSTINNRMGRVRQIGGTRDHLHILFDLHSSIAVADAIHDIKGTSSSWLHQTFPALTGFVWQEGYGVFTVNASAISRLKAYIEGQEDHHKARSFEDEFLALLERHGVRYDSRYLWK